MTPPVFVPASRKAFPPKPGDVDALETPLNIPPAVHERTGVERTMTRFFVLVLFIVALAGAFYAGRRYRGTIPYVDQGQVSDTVASVPSPTVAPDEPMITFEKARRQVDSDPKAWLGNTLGTELSRQGIQTPLQSSDPSFLYLYGRASLLTANYEEAARAFEATIAKADLNPSQSNATLRNEATLGLTAVALKSTAAGPAASRSLEEALQKPTPPARSPWHLPRFPLSSALPGASNALAVHLNDGRTEATAKQLDGRYDIMNVWAAAAMPKFSGPGQRSG